MTLPPGPLHHVSALTNDLHALHAFYTTTLGLSELARTVNQDSPGMPHFFYGHPGTVGSEITFFLMPRAAREHRGRDAVSLTTFRVPPGALPFWAARLSGAGVPYHGLREYGPWRGIEFDDPSGTRLALIADPAAEAETAPGRGNIPAEAALRGLGFARADVTDPAPVRDLMAALGVPSEAHGDETVLRLGSGPQGEYRLRHRPHSPPARPGSGGVHHVALRVQGGAALGAHADALNAAGIAHSGLRERHWFTSLYLGAGGLVVELATDGPGFPHAGSGELELPPFLEPRRAQIEATLPPLPH